MRVAMMMVVVVVAMMLAVGGLQNSGGRSHRGSETDDSGQNGQNGEVNLHGDPCVES
jgi:hypothetical protein